MKAHNETKIIVERIAAAYHPEKIVLFGSRARNEEKAHSDIDLFIIKDTKKKRPFRIQDVFRALRGLDRQYSLDVIVYTPDEVKKRLSLGDPFVTEVLRNGRVMYE